MGAAAWLWTRSILRRHVRSTVFLALFAGLAGGAVLSTWDYSRRAHSVVARRQATTGVPDGTFQSCPPGADPAVDFTPCFQLDSNVTALEGLRRSRHVAASVLYVGYAVQVAVEGLDEPVQLLAQGIVSKQGTLAERQILRGEQVDEGLPDEVVLSEENTKVLRADVGDTLMVAICGFTFFDAEPTCEPPTSVRVVGVARFESDVLPPRKSPPGVNAVSQNFGFVGSYRWWTEHSGEQPSFFTTSFRLAPGSTLSDVRADVATELPGYTSLVTPYEDVSVSNALREATQLQGRTLMIVTLILLVAGVVFVGQALLRQVPRELAAHRTLSALGMDRRSTVMVALLRSIPIAVGAGLIGGTACAIASTFGPTGLAARAEIDTGFRPDWLVIPVGALAVALFVATAVIAAAWRYTRIGTAAARRRRRSLFAAARWPPALRAGVLLGRSSRGGRALATAALGAAAAVVTVCAAGILVRSLERVERDPELYGATWDYELGEFSSAEDAQRAQQRALDSTLFSDVAMLLPTGPIELGDVPPFWAVSFVRLKGDVSPRIVAGRAPVADDEIAVGRSTLADLDLELGDTLDALPVLATGDDDEDEEPTTGAEAPAGAEATAGADTRPVIGPFRIVGVALVATNDMGVGPGEGVILTEQTRLRLDPATGGQLVVRVDPAVPEDEALRQLVDEYGAALSIPNPQTDIRNLRVIAGIPWVIAVLVALLAFAAMAHALVVNVRRSRKTIAVLRTLGFSRAHVVQTVATQATGIAVAAVLVGVPLGLLGGVWAWDRRADALGITAGARIPVLPVILATVAAFVVANATALVLARRAARDDLGVTLRSE